MIGSFKHRITWINANWAFWNELSDIAIGTMATKNEFCQCCSLFGSFVYLLWANSTAYFNDLASLFTKIENQFHTQIQFTESEEVEWWSIDKNTK